MQSEVKHYDRVDSESREARIKTILGLIGDDSRGAAIFDNHCTGCHGREGRETAITPSLYDRVVKLSEYDRLATLLTGKNQMPSWAQLNDSELADLLTFLAKTFETSAP